jgi:hypothetical protein
MINNTIIFENLTNSNINQEPTNNTIKSRERVKFFLKGHLKSETPSFWPIYVSIERKDAFTMTEPIEITMLEPNPAKKVDACAQTNMDEQIDLLFESMNFDRLIHILADQLYNDYEIDAINEIILKFNQKKTQKILLDKSKLDKGKVIPDSPLKPNDNYQVTVIEDTPDRNNSEKSFRNSSSVKKSANRTLNAHHRVSLDFVNKTKNNLNESESFYNNNTTPKSNRTKNFSKLNDSESFIIDDTPNKYNFNNESSLMSDLDITLSRSATRAECVNASKIILENSFSNNRSLNNNKSEIDPPKKAQNSLLKNVDESTRMILGNLTNKDMSKIKLNNRENTIIIADMLKMNFNQNNHMIIADKLPFNRPTPSLAPLQSLNTSSHLDRNKLVVTDTMPFLTENKLIVTDSVENNQLIVTDTVPLNFDDNYNSHNKENSNNLKNDLLIVTDTMPMFIEPITTKSSASKDSLGSTTSTKSSKKLLSQLNTSTSSSIKTVIPDTLKLGDSDENQSTLEVFSTSVNRKSSKENNTSPEDSLKEERKKMNGGLKRVAGQNNVMNNSEFLNSLSHNDSISLGFETHLNLDNSRMKAPLQPPPANAILGISLNHSDSMLNSTILTNHNPKSTFAPAPTLPPPPPPLFKEPLLPKNTNLISQISSSSMNSNDSSLSQKNGKLIKNTTSNKQQETQLLTDSNLMMIDDLCRDMYTDQNQTINEEIYDSYYYQNMNTENMNLAAVQAVSILTSNSQKNRKLDLENQKFEFACSLLTPEMKAALIEYAYTINAKFVNDITDNTTHLIVKSGD